jgi:hypothetical protein
MTDRLVVIATDAYRSGHPQRYYTLMAAEGGTVWSFDCTHLHKSVETARRCRGRLGREWKDWSVCYRRPIPDGTPGLVEMQRTVVRVTYSGTQTRTVTKRIHPIQDVEIVAEIV